MKPTTKKIYDVSVTLHGLKNTKGNVIVAFFNSKKRFLKHPVQHKIVPVTQKDTLTVHFDHISEGNYAVSVIHDENQNQKLDTNFLGIPKEGYGFSNNPKIRMGPASFSECKFAVGDQNLNIQIKMRY